MCVLLLTAANEYWTCRCGNGWYDYDLYACDICGAVLCPDCRMETDDECPNEFCDGGCDCPDN